MHKVYYSLASPYSAKVRMAAAYIGLPLESVVVDIASGPAEVLDANPLGKIPTLVNDDGLAVYDSRTITQYLNRISGNALFPRNAAKRTEAEILEALADGLSDSLVAHIYERRFRPEEKVHQPWLDRQWAKAMRTLDLLNKEPPKLPARITAGHIALRAALAFIALRFPGQWENGRSNLTRWAARFDKKFPQLLPYLPS